MGYLTRMVVRPAVAEELAQTTMLRALEALDAAPGCESELKPWLFRIATNLAIDERRRHGSWRETALLEAKQVAFVDAEFVAGMDALQGTPDGKAAAREHLTVCFSCVLGQLPANQAAALLLVEVYGFTIKTVAGILGADPTQVKNWLQKARSEMRRRYDETCSLVTKRGVCHQCAELDERFGSGMGNPLAGKGDTLGARLAVIRDLRERRYGAWGQMVVSVLDAIED